MIDASLAVQKCIVGRLAAAAIVPVNHVLDKTGRPERFPCVIVGPAFTLFPDYADSFHIETTADVHIWTEDDNLASVKKLTGAAREALWLGPWHIDGHSCVNLRVQQARFMRDPDGIHAHAVLTVTAILQENVQHRWSA